MKESKRLHTACSTARDAKRRHIARPSVMTPCEGGGGGVGLSEADEDYLHFLSQLSANDSDVCSLKDAQGGGPAPGDVDPHYRIFLENLKYESEGSPCTVVFPMDPSIGKNNPFVSARSTDVINVAKKECGKVPSSSDSEFRAGLKSELEMPYDDKEYEDLMKMVTHRRCKEMDKELRGGREVSSVKGVCKSYVDIHKDFARALKLVKGDRKRTLNLLRGFRYCLHNVPKRGSFFSLVGRTVLEFVAWTLVRTSFSIFIDMCTKAMSTDHSNFHYCWLPDLTLRQRPA